MKKVIIKFFLFFFLLASCSEPIKQAQQNLLIQQNKIKIGMNCQNLTEILGGYRAITYLYLEKKNVAPSLTNSYLLLSTASENLQKNFFLCERTRDDNIRIRQKTY